MAQGGGGTLGPRRAIERDRCLSLELLGSAVLIIVKDNGTQTEGLVYIMQAPDKSA